MRHFPSIMQPNFLFSLKVHTVCFIFFVDYYLLEYNMGFPGGSDGKQTAHNAGDPGSVPGLGRFPGGECDDPLQSSCQEKPHGQRSLAGYSPRGHKELDTTERLSSHTTEKKLEKGPEG